MFWYPISLKTHQCITPNVFTHRHPKQLFQAVSPVCSHFQSMCINMPYTWLYVTFSGPNVPILQSHTNITTVFPQLCPSDYYYPLILNRRLQIIYCYLIGEAVEQPGDNQSCLFQVTDLWRFNLWGQWPMFWVFWCSQQIENGKWIMNIQHNTYSLVQLTTWYVRMTRKTQITPNLYELYAFLICCPLHGLFICIQLKPSQM